MCLNTLFYRYLVPTYFFHWKQGHFFFSFKLGPKLFILFLVVGLQTSKDEPSESSNKKRWGLEMDVSPQSLEKAVPYK